MKKNQTIIGLTVAALLLGGYFYIYGHKDMTGATYSEIEAYKQAHPRRTVTYTVTIDDTLSLTESSAIAELTDAAQVEPLTEQAAYLQGLTEIRFSDAVPTALQIAAVQEAFPCATVLYDTLEILGVTYDADITELDLSAMTAAQTHEAAAALQALPKLTDVYLSADDAVSNVSLDDAAALYAARPELTFHYTTELFGQCLSTDMETVAYYKTDIGDEGLAELRKLLPMMHELTYLKLDTCKTSNEAMAQLRDDFADQCKVVWRVFMGRFNCLTDTYKVWITYGLTNETAALLKYCTEVKYLDIGHNINVDDVSFLAYMPDLEVCIIAECSGVTDLTPLKGCTKLEYLELFLTDVTDLSPISELNSLEHLNLSCMHIKDLTALDNLTNLKRVWTIGSTKISWDEIDRFKQLHPDCNFRNWGEHSTDAGWRYLDDDDTIPHRRYSLLRKQIGYDTWDISQGSKGHVTEPITFESTGIKPI